MKEKVLGKARQSQCAEEETPVVCWGGECLKSGTTLEDSPQFKRTQAEKLDVYFLQTVTKCKRLPKRPYQMSV